MSNIFVTGPSGSGKSTLVSEVVEEMSLKVHGLRTPDIREKGRRKGFKLVDIASGEEGILSHVDQEDGPKVSKYRVNMQDLERFTELSLRNIPKDVDLVVIDEIGTMELFSDNFEDAVIQLLESDIPVLAVLHRNYTYKFGEYGKLYRLDRGNYDEVKESIKMEL